MVYRGPSKGCFACRKRRVKCDEQRPSCGNCIKRKLVCPGYRNLFDAVHKDETRVTTQKSQARSYEYTDSSASDTSLSSSSGDDLGIVKYESNNGSDVVAPLQLDIELRSLCFFFANYVNVPRESHSCIYIEHILPTYLNAPPDSPLKLATASAAINMHQMWHNKGANPKEGRAVYTQAIAALRSSLADPKTAYTDETLCTIFMLDFQELLKHQFMNDSDRDTHQKGAIALIRQRGLESFTNDKSRRLMHSLRNRYISYAITTRRRVELEDDMLTTAPDDPYPAPKFDLLQAEWANLVHDSRALIDHESVPFNPQSPMSPNSDTESITHEEILKRAIDLDARLHDWRRNLPEAWMRFRIEDTSIIHPSIRAVGMYNDLCDVYNTVAASHSQNMSRVTQISLLRLMKHCLRRLDKSSPYLYLITEDELDLQIQNYVDDICASVPYHLGNRTTFSAPDEIHEYPPVPPAMRAKAVYLDSFGQQVVLTEKDHNRSAASIGGWFLLMPLGALARMTEPEIVPNGFLDSSTANLNDLTLNEEKSLGRNLELIRLRPGQRMWILRQIQRCRALYLLPPMATRVSA